MAIKKLILGKNNSEQTFIFDKKINVLDDLELSKQLRTENIKNEDSPLIIKSMNDTHIADVIQIKINLTSVGTFLVNFNKDLLKEEDRKTMFDELTSLKNKEEPTEKAQTEKASKILMIVDKYNPVYVAFSNKGEIKIDINSIAKNISWTYPLLVLAIPPKQPSLFSKIFNKNKKENLYINIDNFFITIFSLLCVFSFVTGIHEVLAKQNVAYFLIGLAIVFTCVLGYVSSKILLPSKNKQTKFILLIYSLIGWIIGSIVAVIISKFLLTNKDATFELMKVIGFGGVGALLLCTIPIFVPLLFRKKKSIKVK